MALIRPGRLDELEGLRVLEVQAGRPFAEIGMAAVANDEPPSIDTFSGYCKAERLWVAVNETDTPVAFVLLDVVDECAHIEQVSVHPDYAGRRIGQALITHVEIWAQERNFAAVTLTTFLEVPWNAPYYQRLGYEVMTDLTPGLIEIRALEGQHGLDRWPRVCMRKAV